MWWQENSYHVEPTPVAWEFYDLRKDPAEIVNRYDDPAYSDIIAALKDDLKEKRKKLNETDAGYPRFQKVIDQYWN